MIRPACSKGLCMAEARTVLCTEIRHRMRKHLRSLHAEACAVILPAVSLAQRIAHQGSSLCISASSCTRTVSSTPLEGSGMACGSGTFCGFQLGVHWVLRFL